ncbi:MAG: TIGR03960 family B12-binding radical SAM protein [Leptonema sp. (in: bacteria)]
MRFSLIEKERFLPKIEYIDRDSLIPLLQRVEKPGRYVGGEFGIPQKNLENHLVKVLLSYPDIYDLGMSNEGLKILYDQIHKNGYFADRVFLPKEDFGSLLKINQIPLYSLDHFLKVTSFDLWGFNVAHELHFTNVLYALDLAGIPLKRKDRNASEPLIILGGTAISNPLPMFDFVDGIFLGDGEEAILEIIKRIEEGKKTQKTREEILKNLENLSGLLLPEFYEIREESEKEFPKYIGKIVSKRTYKSNEFANLKNIIIPNISITQDRTVLEVNRGCGQGCRFCHAGFWKRPVRNIEVENLVRIAGELLDRTGNNILTLHSLSIADYPWLEELVIELANRYGPEGVSLSLPSLRVQVKTIPILEMTSDIRKSSITFALEAGSEILREKIHKKSSEENLHYLIHLVFQRGWNTVKVYFMLGLPDYEGREVSDLIRALNTLGFIAKSYGKRKKINISISLFVPKPFTTFQWEEQKSPEYFEESIKKIKQNVKYKQIWIRHPKPWMSYVEGLLSRSDHRMGKYLYKAYLKGAIFDSWDDGFREDIWKEIFEEIPEDLKTLWLSKKSVETRMPWEEIIDGFPREKLLRDYEKFLSINENNMNPAKKQILDPQKFPQELFKKVSIPKEKFITETFVELKFAKIQEFIYISHLDTLEVFRKALRRAKIPLTFSRGFNKHEKIKSLSSLPLYVYSLSEKIYLELYKKMDLENQLEIIQKNLPNGLYITNIKEIQKEDFNFEEKDSFFYLEFLEENYREKIYKELFNAPKHIEYIKENKILNKEIQIESISLSDRDEFSKNILKYKFNSEVILKNLYKKNWKYGIQFHLVNRSGKTISLKDLILYYLKIPIEEWNVSIRIIKF